MANELIRASRTIGVATGNVPGRAQAKGVAFTVAGAGRSAGAPLSNLGSTMLQAAEDRLKFDSARAAEDAAFSAPILRDENGQVVHRATPSGGFTFQALYEDFRNDLIATDTQNFLGAEFNRIFSENVDNPQYAAVLMQSTIDGHLDGMENKALAGRLRPVLEATALSQVRTLNLRKTDADALLVRDGLLDATSVTSEQYSNALIAGSYEVAAEHRRVLNHQVITGIERGYVTPMPGRTPEEQAAVIDGRIAKQARLYRSLQLDGSKGLLTKEKLERLQTILLGGGDSGGGPIEFTGDKFDVEELVKLFPDAKTRGELATMVGKLSTQVGAANTITQSDINVNNQLSIWAGGRFDIHRGMPKGDLNKAIRQVAAAMGVDPTTPEGAEKVYAATGQLDVEAINNLFGRTVNTDDELDQKVSLLKLLREMQDPLTGRPRPLTDQLEQKHVAWVQTYETFREVDRLDRDAAVTRTIEHIEITKKIGNYEIIKEALAEEVGTDALGRHGKTVSARMSDMLTKAYPDYDEMPAKTRLQLQRSAEVLLAGHLKAKDSKLAEAVADATQRLKGAFGQSAYVVGRLAPYGEMPPLLDNALGAGEPSSRDWLRRLGPSIAANLSPTQFFEFDQSQIMPGENIRLKSTADGRPGHFYVYGKDPANTNGNYRSLNGLNGTPLVIDITDTYNEFKKVRTDQIMTNAVVKDAKDQLWAEIVNRIFFPLARESYSEIGPGPSILPESVTSGAPTSQGPDVHKGETLDLTEPPTELEGTIESPSFLDALGTSWNRYFHSVPLTVMGGGNLPPDAVEELLEQSATITPPSYDDAGLPPVNSDSLVPKSLAPADEEVDTRSPGPSSEVKTNSLIEFASSERLEWDPVIVGDAVITAIDNEEMLSEADFIKKHTIQASYEPPEGDEYRGGNDITQAAMAVGKEIGAHPEDLLTIISFETGGTLHPWELGKVKTRHGEHRGWIQWGEEQAATYGVHESMSSIDQMRAVGKYLQDNGFKPGMGTKEMYEAIFGGEVGVGNVSDVHRSRDQALYEMEQGHRARAKRMLRQAGQKLPKGGDFKITIGGAKIGKQFDQVDQQVVALAANAYIAIGESSMDVASGFRTKTRNDEEKGAKLSQHLHGRALDLNTTGWSREKKLKLIDALSAGGAGGIGVYANNIHVDIAGRRSWGPTFKRKSVPAWAEAAIQRHEGGKGGQKHSVPQSYAFKNNNPAGIQRTFMTGGFPGMTGEAAGMMTFDNPYNGMQALGSTLVVFEQQGYNTPETFIDNWRPEESPFKREAMTKLLSRVAGVAPDKEMNIKGNLKRATRVAAALIALENGSLPYRPGFIETALKRVV